MNIRLASKSTCTGCLVCVDSCNRKAIKANLCRDGHLYPEINAEQCVKCGKCMQVCPIVSSYDFQDSTRASKPYAVWANDREIRLKSASGGLFAALAVKVLADGGVVAGAAMNGVWVKHILIEDAADLNKLQNSKYQQGDTSGIYEGVKEKLEEGRTVLFSGTSCQVAGLYSFINKSKYPGKLYTTDLVCTGFPSRLPLDIVLAREKEQVETLCYRDKDDGKNKHRLSDISNRNEHRKILSHEVFTAAFNRHYTHRASCLNCRFTHIQRKSDITMADFWGDTDYPEQHDDGLSLAVVHSEKGMELLKSADLTYHLSTWGKALRVNFRLIYGRFYMSRFHPARIFMVWVFRHCSYPDLLKIYRAEGIHYGMLWYPYQLYSKMLGCIEKSLRQIIMKRKIKRL